MKLPDDLTIRHTTPDDHPRVLAVLDRWWGEVGGSEGSRQRALLLPRLFFQHFTDSGFLVERDGEPVGFLIGFLSQSRADESYVHFVGVSPEARGHGLGRLLYQRFFDHSREHGRSRVRAITSTANLGSYGFHTRMGFAVEPGVTGPDGRQLHPDYDGPGLDRVAFVRAL
ncbi:GNAT family N-acetyltransferase [Streptacidiphilus sp. P02-A3a]|uniref:GNAT family N-acetyltransferase n=1 Tax=Streptacidiphilus sp. P02-A3a TaxID=2704468 RepID=UPI0015FC1F1A|nr:GNAT family N-acetyltransferase [Streptacidiphilus sp. P02-A3a]QMU71312.1 GNAT family N-acetyltransferase [Streptacidiphilus sp. P02-A3a]